MGRSRWSITQKIKELSANGFAQVKAATLAAGRGECLSYRNVTMEVEPPAEWAQLEAADKAYDRHRAAVYRAMDAEDERDDHDNTPAHKSDM